LGDRGPGREKIAYILADLQPTKKRGRGKKREKSVAPLSIKGANPADIACKNRAISFASSKRKERGRKGKRKKGGKREEPGGGGRSGEKKKR